MAHTEGFDVVVASGTHLSADPAAATFPHRWTSAGVTVETDFTGAHLLHLAVAGCVLNDVHREAVALEIAVDGVRVTACGGFDTETWESSGIGYVVEVDCDPARRAELLDRVDAVAEIPRTVRAGASVTRR